MSRTYKLAWREQADGEVRLIKWRDYGPGHPHYWERDSRPDLNTVADQLAVHRHRHAPRKRNDYKILCSTIRGSRDYQVIQGNRRVLAAEALYLRG